jgi:hypothetical protein
MLRYPLVCLTPCRIPIPVESLTVREPETVSVHVLVAGGSVPAMIGLSKQREVCPYTLFANSAKCRMVAR